MALGTLKNTRLTILLSLNAVAIIIAGVLIANAIGLNKGLEFKVVSERSDIVGDTIKPVGLLGSASDSASASAVQAAYSEASLGKISTDPVPDGQLWNETSITMYQTADFDLCVGGGLTDLGEMYWQTSDPNIISGFYPAARTWLGFNSKTCRYPSIKGTGSVTITAGTYDGTRHDSIVINVVAPPIKQWKDDVLKLVNDERQKNNLALLEWGPTCEAAADLRANEIAAVYSHTRPDGSDWSTACPIPPTGGMNGENLNAGNAAVDPKTTVISWMNSEEHRKNILNPDFTKLDVGFVLNQNSDYKTYWSQFFSTY